MKIQVVELSEIEVVETNGTFEARYINKEKAPAFITNYALKRGKDLGLLTSSLLATFAKFGNITPDSIEELSNLDESEFQKVVYLGCLGANPNFKYTFEEFLERYHYDFTKTMDLYSELIMPIFDKAENKFAKSFPQGNKSKKKYHR